MLEAGLHTAYRSPATAASTGSRLTLWPWCGRPGIAQISTESSPRPCHDDHFAFLLSVKSPASLFSTGVTAARGAAIFANTIEPLAAADAQSQNAQKPQNPSSVRSAISATGQAGSATNHCANRRGLRRRRRIRVPSQTDSNGTRVWLAALLARAKGHRAVSTDFADATESEPSLRFNFCDICEICGKYGARKLRKRGGFACWPQSNLQRIALGLLGAPLLHELLHDVRAPQ